MQSCDHHAYSKVSHMEKREWDKLTGIIDFDEFRQHPFEYLQRMC